jgi:hypothetical protein
MGNFCILEQNHTTLEDYIGLSYLGLVKTTLLCTLKIAKA